MLERSALNRYHLAMKSNTPRKVHSRESRESRETEAKVKPPSWAARHPAALGGLVLAAIVLVVFGDVLFTDRDRMLLGSDVYIQFLPVRTFAFDELAHGNLALWNPHIYSGTPLVGNFQSALLYPPNLIFLVLPINRAINLCFALHIWLTGMFMFLWCRKRGLQFVSALLPAILLMLGGTVFLHVWEGHLTDVCTLAWSPLILLAVDGICDERGRRLKWFLIGAAAVGMSILASHAQYVFYTAVAAGLYCLLRLPKTSGRMQAVAAFAGMYAAGALLSAAQLLTGMQASAESVRGSGISFRLAATHSFRFENFFTMLSPDVLGCENYNASPVAYWGQSYQSVMCLFLSATGLVLAIYGALRGEKNQRRFSALMAGVLLLLALGYTTERFTHLFSLLFYHVPGFNKFRGWGKFTFPASLFIVMLSGVGLEAILKDARKRWGLVIGAAAAAVAVAALGLVIGYGSGGDSGWWSGLVHNILSTDESHFRPPALLAPQAIAADAQYACTQLLYAAGVLAAVAVIVLVCQWQKKAAYALAVLGAAEVILFSMNFEPVDSLKARLVPKDLQSILAQPNSDYRIHVAIPPMVNHAMYYGGLEIWGHEPGPLARYAQFIAYTQDHDPNDCAEFFPIGKLSRFFDMLRLKYTLTQDGQIHESHVVMNRVNLVGSYELASGRDEAFKAMSSAEFDPRATVVLEQKPSVEPVADQDQGWAKVVDSSTDWLTIEAEVKSPAILLVTDSYSKYWRARPLAGSSQQQYEVLPADYTLRGVPLGQGHHLIRMEYVPSGWVIGKWVSIAALVMYAGAMAVYYAKSREKSGADSKEKEIGRDAGDARDKDKKMI